MMNRPYFQLIYEDWVESLSPDPCSPAGFNSLIHDHYPSMEKLTNSDNHDPLGDVMGSHVDSSDNSKASSGEWALFYKKQDSIKQIEIDLDRLYPSFTSLTTTNNTKKQYFQTPAARRTLLRILFLYSEMNKHKISEYKQGMHEICSVIYYVVNEAFGTNHCDDVEDDGTSELATEDKVPSLVFALFSSVMKNLFVFYDVAGEGRCYKNAKLSSDTEGDEDLMARLFDGKKSYIVNECAFIQSVLMRKVEGGRGKEISEWLDRFNVIPQVYLLKWLRLMFIRECASDFDLLTRIWGSVFKAFRAGDEPGYPPPPPTPLPQTPQTPSILNQNAKKNAMKTIHLSVKQTVFIRQLGKIACAMIAIRQDVVFETREENGLLMLLMNFEFNPMEGKSWGDALGKVIDSDGYGIIDREERRLSLERDRRKDKNEGGSCGEAKAPETPPPPVKKQQSGAGEGGVKKTPGWMLGDSSLGSSEAPRKRDVFSADDDDDGDHNDNENENDSDDCKQEEEADGEDIFGTNRRDKLSGGGGLFGGTAEKKKSVRAVVEDGGNEDEDDDGFSLFGKGGRQQDDFLRSRDEGGRSLLFPGDRLSKPSSSGNLFGEDDEYDYDENDGPGNGDKHNDYDFFKQNDGDGGGGGGVENQNQNQNHRADHDVDKNIGNLFPETSQMQLNTSPTPTPPPPPTPTPTIPTIPKPSPSNPPPSVDLSSQMEEALRTINNYLQDDGAGAPPSVWRALEQLEQIKLALP